MIKLLLILLFLTSTAQADITTGLVAWWKFDEGTGTSAFDSTGNGNTLAFNGSTTWSSPGKIGPYAVNTTASNAYLSTAGVSIGSTWTLSGWTFFPLSLGSYNTMFRNAAAAGNGDHQILVDPTGQLGVYMNSNSTMFHDSGYNVSSLTGWHLVTAVGTGGTTVFYIDGSSVGTSNAQSTQAIDTVGNYYLGTQPWGILDDTRIYTRALTTGDIAQLYAYTGITNLGITINNAKIANAKFNT